MTKKANEHPLKGFPNTDKVAYLCLIASIAKVDGKITSEELENLRELCEITNLSDDDVGKVMSFAISSSNKPNDVKQYIEQLKNSDLRFTLVTDMFMIAYSDNELANDELEEIKRISLELGVKEEQFEALKKYVKVVKKASKATGINYAELSTDAIGSLAAVGVPLGAVAVSGSVFGLSAAGMTSGLAALGLGFGMASGIGAVAVIGIGTYAGVKWLGKQIFS